MADLCLAVQPGQAALSFTVQSAITSPNTSWTKGHASDWPQPSHLDGSDQVSRTYMCCGWQAPSIPRSAPDFIIFASVVPPGFTPRPWLCWDHCLKGTLWRELCISAGTLKAPGPIYSSALHRKGPRKLHWQAWEGSSCPLSVPNPWAAQGLLPSTTSSGRKKENWPSRNSQQNLT